MKKILYIEDNEDTAQAVKIILEMLGHKTELAYTGTQGIQKAKKKTYDLIIFDVMLPDLSGIKVFDTIRKEKKQKKTKYAFLTITFIPLEKKKELQEQGVLDFIPKPFQKEELTQKIKTILQ
jgi:two-component system alkaline phosphatase synthesis response regulator PhoP